mmetsp:Transcript_34252/g.84815  ORF Transcript_34252/g.84815 Transcript_34252/m.84815 type:complete len:128 (+) Transcript_34252:4910-5293(+)
MQLTPLTSPAHPHHMYYTAGINDIPCLSVKEKDACAFCLFPHSLCACLRVYPCCLVFFHTYMPSMPIRISPHTRTKDACLSFSHTHTCTECGNQSMATRLSFVSRDDDDDCRVSYGPPALCPPVWTR